MTWQVMDPPPSRAADSWGEEGVAMGDIGRERREVEFEPLTVPGPPLTVPQPVPAQPQPQPEPVPVPVGQPA
jgi:hypothetical protein